MKVRRVVTGHDASGKAAIVSDEQVEPITMALLQDAENHRLWGVDEPPSFPDAGAATTGLEYYPPVGGMRFGFFTVPTADATAPDADFDIATALGELEEKLPGMARYLEPDSGGMHATPTVDCEIVLSGEVILELEDGTQAVLRPGDTVVQNGTRHTWRIAGTEPARVAIFMIGAHHERFGT